MISVQRTKELLGDPPISDEEAEQIRDAMRKLAEIIFEKWLLEKNKIDTKK